MCESACATLAAVALAAVVVCGCSAGRAPSAKIAAPGVVVAPAPPASAPAPLAPGEAVEGDLAGGERCAYPVTLGAGDYARFYVEQRLAGDRGIDLVVSLTAPDGSQVDAVDGPGGVAVGEQLSLVAPAGGTYALVLAVVDPAAPRGRYRVELEERRAGRPGDEARVVIERKINEASQLSRLETEEADSRALAELAEALPLAERAGDAGHQGDCLTLMGDVHLARGQLQEARDLYTRAVEPYRRAGDRAGEAIALSNLGLTSRKLGDAAGALDGYRQALAVWTELGDGEERAKALHNMAVAAMAQGDLDQAASWLGEALPLWRSTGALAGEANSLNALADLELRRGEVDRALEDATAALARSRQAGAKSAEAYCLNSLAGIQRVRGDLLTARATYGEALKLNRRRGAAGDEAKVLDNLGVLESDLGEPEVARQNFEQALAVYTRLHLPDGQVDALCHLGSVQARYGDAAGALATFERALPLSRQLANPLSEALTLQWSGSALRALGRFDEAVERLRRALELEGAAEDRVGETLTRLELGSALAARGDVAEARQQLESALRLSLDLGFRVAESRARLRLATLDRRAGDLDRALSGAELAVQIYEDLRAALVGDQLRTSLFASSREYYEFYIDLLMELARQRPGAGYAERAFAVSERARARGLLDLLAEGRVELTRGIGPELRVEERRLEQRTAATERRLSEVLSARSPEATRVARLRDELSGLAGERRRLDERIRGEAPRYAELRHPSPLEAPAVQALLGDRQVLLEYSVGTRASYLFVVTRDRLQSFPLPPAAELRAEVAAYREALTSDERRNRGAFILAARQLYDRLVAPAEPLLQGKPELLIAPDGALYFVAFDALLTPGPAGGGWSDLPFLLRRRAISYVPSASVLATLAAAPAGERASGEPGKLFVAFADPAYGLAEGLAPSAARASSPERLGALPRLVESGREVEEIAGLFGADRSALYLREAATEANVKQSAELRTARWVHFAAHGLIDEERPEKSGLVLTPVADPADPSDDGVLRVGEIFNLELDADLVVLSACDTGLGKEVSGEGLVGLTRAFLYAGTLSIVVSLWEVEDRSTADLMVELKRNLDRGDDTAEALREAKLTLLRTPGAAAPRLWAPFVLVGLRQGRGEENGL